MFIRREKKKKVCGWWCELQYAVYKKYCSSLVQSLQISVMAIIYLEVVSDFAFFFFFFLIVYNSNILFRFR